MGKLAGDCLTEDLIVWSSPVMTTIESELGLVGIIGMDRVGPEIHVRFTRPHHSAPMFRPPLSLFGAEGKGRWAGGGEGSLTVDLMVCTRAVDGLESDPITVVWGAEQMVIPVETVPVSVLNLKVAAPESPGWLLPAEGCQFCGGSPRRSSEGICEACLATIRAADAAEAAIAKPLPDEMRPLAVSLGRLASGFGWFLGIEDWGQAWRLRTVWIYDREGPLLYRQNPHQVGPLDRRIAAQDDQGNRYKGFPHRGGGGGAPDGTWLSDLTFTPALHPAATELTVTASSAAGKQLLSVHLTLPTPTAERMRTLSR